MTPHLKAFFTIAILFISVCSEAQVKMLGFLNEKIDTNYISDKSKMLTVRVLGSSKYYSHSLMDDGNALSYKANNHYNIGVGAVYSFLGANITVKAPFINNDTAKFGNTKKFDAQAFLFPRKMAVDFYFQYYKGFYIDEKGITQTYLPNDRKPLRPDIRTLHIGANASYVFDARRFSFRAAFVQNEYQKKSAGTPLFGGSIHYNSIAGDSAIIPADISYADFFDNNRFRRSAAFSAGIHGGYGYTLVVARHFFATGVALVGAGANYSYLQNDVNTVFAKKIGVQAAFIYKAAVGYNSETFYAGILYMGATQRNSSPISTWQQYAPGVMRLVVAKRFAFSPAWKKQKKTKAVLDVQ